MEEGYRYSHEEARGPAAELTGYDKLVGDVLRMLGFGLICIAAAIAFGVVVPAQGFEAIAPGGGLSGLIFASLCLTFSGHSLRAERGTEYFGTRDLLDRRLKALFGTAAALLILYIAIN